MICYVFEYRPGLQGVNQKIVSKIEGLNKMGIPIRGILIHSVEIEEDIIKNHPLIDAVSFHSEASPKFTNNRFFSFLKSYFINKQLNNLISIELQKRNPEIIIKRYGYEDIHTLKLVQKFKNKFVLEVNTDQLEQIRSVWNYKSIWSSPLWQSYMFYSERIYSSKILKKTRGVVCVTRELEGRVRTKLGMNYNGKVITISNGVETQDYEAQFPKISSTWNFIMIMGVNSEWNGLDIIAGKIDENPNLNLKLHVVGNVDQITKNEKIVYHGRKSKVQIDELIKSENIHAGVGTLALERKGISEASPLKVREYLSRGLPVLYNYNDTDIDSDEDFKEQYMLKFDGELDLKEVSNKLSKIYDEQSVNDKIKSWAKENIDFKIKLAEYIKIIEK